MVRENLSLLSKFQVHQSHLPVYMM